MRPLKINLRLQEQEPNPLVAKINSETLQEEKVEEPAEHLLHRQKKSNAGQKGDELGLEKDDTPKLRPEGLEPRKESKLVQQEPVTEQPMRPHTTILGVQETVVSVVQEPVIELSVSLTQQQ